MELDIANNVIKKEGTKVIAIDFDRTLCFYENSYGVGEVIGEPIPSMLKRVKKWIKEGHQIFIFTARVAPNIKGRDIPSMTKKIESWCLKHVGTILPVTCMKLHGFDMIIDDIAVPIIRNTGKQGTLVDIDKI